MLSLRYILLLLFITINGRNWISANILDLMSVDDKNGIFKTIEHRKENPDSRKWSNTDIEQSCRSKGFEGKFSLKKDSVNGTDQIIFGGQNTTNAFNLQLEQLSKNLSIGDKFEFNSQSIFITLEKVSSKNITGKRLIQSDGAKIRFPQLNINKSVLINLITIPSLSIVSLTLHDQSGEIINIQNTTKPFEIIIPRQMNSLMPPLVRQNATLSSKNSKFKYHFINLTHSVNLSISLHIEMESENVNLSYLFIIRFSGVPDLQTDLIDDWKLVCPKDRKNGTLKYTYFIKNTQILHHQWAILGIREMKECNRDNLDNNIQFSSDYSIRMYTSGCYYLDNQNNWQSDGLIVGSESNERSTQCYSTHLTTFAGGFVVLPPPIDFNDLDFAVEKNLTIYITLIVIGLLYLVTVGCSYYKDGIDAKMLMVMPLRDNNQRDTYLYQLVVFTGMRPNAGTKSNVHFILSGNDDDTSVRKLTADRRILDRGHTDSFIMAVPRSLGHLNYLRVWHDNSGSGSDASWFLKYIIVRDLQTMETNYFICENWLAVEENSGEIERTITIASEFEQRELKHMLSKNAYRSMADNHLWFSVFAYHLPSANRFTRVQRCTCCFVVLFMSLLMNILYYDMKDELKTNELDPYAFTIGPFHISKEEIGVGIIVELVIFFPSVFLITLFRRTKPRRPRTISPVGEALETIRIKKTKTGNTSHVNRLKEKKFLFPWWCLILAYILSFLIVAISIVFILVKSVEIKDAGTRKWLGAILASFCASVLLTQPLKVLSLAILFMCFCRKKSQVEAFIEEEDPVEDFTVSTTDAHRKFPPKSVLAKTRHDPYRAKREKAALKKLRDIRLKEVKAWFILRELFILLLFLGVLYAISFANRDIHNAHVMVNHLRQEFLSVDYYHQHKYDSKHKGKIYIYENMDSIEDYWNWLENVFVNKYLELTRNIQATNKSYIATSNRVIGLPTLRQLRVKNESCPRKALHGRMEINDCNLPYTWHNEAKTPFGSNTNVTDEHKYTKPFKYRPAQDNTLVYSTPYATYMGGGYVHEIESIYPTQIKNGLRNLRSHHWIDRHTRAVFLTFGLYNPNANIFVHCSLLLEQLPATRNLIFRPSFQPLKLVHLYTGADLIYCLVYLILIIYYMFTEIKVFFRKRKGYIKRFWSYINWAIIVCSWFGVVIHVFRQIEVKKMGQMLKKTNVKLINLQLFAYFDSLLTYLLGFCCFFGTIKILRLLRFNRRMSLLHLTLKKSARQILGFLLLFSIIFVAFISLFHLLFYSNLKQYSTWLETSITCFEMISLHFSTVPDLKNVNPLLAGFCLFLFIFLAVFLLSNMFISIIVDNFNIIRREQLKRENEVELIQFTMEKMKQWLGMRSIKREMEQKKNPVVEFPDKIDKLMMAIDKVYKDTNH